MIGVYCLEFPNHHYYVGMTTRSFSERWKQHLKEARNNTHPTTYIQNFYNKHGENAWKEVKKTPLFSVKKPNTRNQLRTIEKSLLKKEKEWWEVLHLDGARLVHGKPTGTGSVLHTKETREKIAAAQSLSEEELYTVRKCVICEKPFKILRRRPTRSCSRKCGYAASAKANRFEYEYEEIYNLYWKEGRSRSEIGEILGIGQTTVLNVMERLNIPRRTTSEALREKAKTNL